MVIDDQSINLNEVDQDGGNTIFHYIINDFEMMKLFTERLEMNSEALKIQNSDLETPIDILEFKNEIFCQVSGMEGDLIGFISRL